MRVTLISIVLGTFGIVSKGLERELDELGTGGRIETAQTKVLLKSARILRVLDT